MRIVAVADTHSKQRLVDVPEGNVFVHAGDFMGKSYSYDQLASFVFWLNELPHPTKIVVPGNHDGLSEKEPAMCRAFFSAMGVRYETAGSFQIDETIFSCCSYTPAFNNWHFQSHSYEEAKKRLASRLDPRSTLVITHGPPSPAKTVRGEDAGCPALREWIDEHQPEVHIHGHIHEVRGERAFGNTRSYGVSVLDERYQKVQDATVIDL